MKKQKKPKIRNYVAKHAVLTTSGAGAHVDRKKDLKMGKEKHKTNLKRDWFNFFKKEIDNV